MNIREAILEVVWLVVITSLVTCVARWTIDLLGHWSKEE